MDAVQHNSMLMAFQCRLQYFWEQFTCGHTSLAVMCTNNPSLEQHGRKNFMIVLQYSVTSQVDLSHPAVKVGENAWERHSQARHFCHLAFP